MTINVTEIQLEIKRARKCKSTRVFGHLRAPAFSIEVDLCSPQPKLHQRMAALL